MNIKEEYNEKQALASLAHNVDKGEYGVFILDTGEMMITPNAKGAHGLVRSLRRTNKERFVMSPKLKELMRESKEITQSTLYEQVLAGVKPKASLNEAALRFSTTKHASYVKAFQNGEPPLRSTSALQFNGRGHSVEVGGTGIFVTDTDYRDYQASHKVTIQDSTTGIALANELLSKIKGDGHLAMRDLESKGFDVDWGFKYR